MLPRDPQVPATLSIAVPAWYTKLRPRAVRPNPVDSVLRNQVGYIGLREKTSRRDQRAVLKASLMDSYRDVLDDVARQSRHWHSLLRRARVCTTSADHHYQRHNRRVQLFSVMSQLWASKRAAHRVESPLPKRQCRTRPGILGPRPPPDMAPAQRRKLVTLEDLWGMAHT